MHSTVSQPTVGPARKSPRAESRTPSAPLAHTGAQGHFPLIFAPERQFDARQCFSGSRPEKCITQRRKAAKVSQRRVGNVAAVFFLFLVFLADSLRLCAFA